MKTVNQVRNKLREERKKLAQWRREWQRGVEQLRSEVLLSLMDKAATKMEILQWVLKTSGVDGKLEEVGL